MAGKPAAARHLERAPGQAPRAPVALAQSATGAAAGASLAAGAGSARQPYPDLAAPPGGGTGVTSADRALQAWLARFTGGLSPVSLGLAWFDWAAHLAGMPGRQAELLARAWRNAIALPGYTLPGAGPAAAAYEPRPQDPRFTAPGWQRWPFTVMSQAFLSAEQWWQDATTGVPGVSRHHERVVSFGARQLLDVVSPSNFPWSNPEVLEATAAQGGTNLVRGARLFAEDWQRLLTRAGPVGTEAFIPGQSVAVTPGKVVLRNDLFEGRYLASGRPVTLSDIRVPVFMVATVRDHVAPWRSVYKLNLAAETELTFLLTSGGHNAGIVSEPGHPHRSFQVATRPARAPYTPPDTWVAATRMHEGSWWPAWQGWLAHRSGGREPPPPMGAPGRGYPALADAPGSYVHGR